MYDLAFEVCVECGYTPEQVANMSFAQIERLAQVVHQRRARNTFALLFGVVNAIRAFRFGAAEGEGRELGEYMETLMKEAGHGDQKRH